MQDLRQRGNMTSEAKSSSKTLSYHDLEVYKLAHSLAVQVHGLSLKLPKFEMYEEGAQIRRSAKSIPVNLVEGLDGGTIRSNTCVTSSLRTLPVMKHSSICAF